MESKIRRKLRNRSRITIRKRITNMRMNGVRVFKSLVVSLAGLHDSLFHFDLLRFTQLTLGPTGVANRNSHIALTLLPR